MVTRSQFCCCWTNFASVKDWQSTSSTTCWHQNVHRATIHCQEIKQESHWFWFHHPLPETDGNLTRSVSSNFAVKVPTSKWHGTNLPDVLAKNAWQRQQRITQRRGVWGHLLQISASGCAPRHSSRASASGVFAPVDYLQAKGSSSTQFPSFQKNGRGRGETIV